MRGERFVVSTALAGSSWFLGGAAAHADDSSAPPIVTLVIAPCTAVDAAEAERLLAIELRADVQRGSATDSSATTKVVVRCESELVVLDVDDPLTRKTVSRSIDLAETPPQARARVLALAISELVSASWAELDTNPEPAVEPARPAPPAAALNAAKHALHQRTPMLAPSTYRFVAFAEVRTWLPRTGPSFGGGLRLGSDRGRWVAWSAEVAGDRGVRSLARGDVAFESLSLGATLGVRFARGPLALRSGPGLRFGLSTVSGTPADPSSTVGGQLTGVWGGPSWTLGTTVLVGGGVVVELLADAGYSGLGVAGHVAGGRDVSVSGPFLGLSFGVGLVP